MTPPKLVRLTAEQEALLPVKRDQWIRTGLSTERANRPEAEAGVRLAYEAAGLTPPPFIIWVDSPYAGAWAQAIAPEIIHAAVGDRLRSNDKSVWAQVWAQVRDQVWDQVDQVWAQVGDQVDQVRAQVRDQVDQVWAQVGDQVRAQVWDQVWDQVDQVWDQVWDQVDQVWAQVWAQVRDQVRDQVWDQVDQVRDQVRDQPSSAVRDRLSKWTDGINDSYWGLYYSSWVDTMRELGVEHLEPWEGQQKVAGSAFWWWCFAGFAVICERPTVLKRDEEGRLHAGDGPAMQWPDGWGFHSWHGTRVPAWVIEEPSPKRAMKEPNSEIRRCAAERIGWAVMSDALGLKPLATCADPANDPHELTLYKLPRDWYGQAVNLLLMTNGSPDRSGDLRLYAETVPASITDPLAAAAWQYQVPTEVYARLERRT